MNSTDLTKVELTSAVERGVCQLVIIGPQGTTRAELCGSLPGSLQVFAVDEETPEASDASFVPTQFGSEELAAALERSTFDKFKASLFIWLGDASYRTLDAALSTLSFIASLPKGSGVIFDYAAEARTSGSVAGTALDALASRFSCATGAVKYMIQPQAVAALLRGLGFGQMLDYADEELSLRDRHIVSALL